MDAHRILIIEDDDFLRTLAINKLAAAGFAVDAASDGATGFDKIAQNPPELLLLDLMLPTMDGFQIMERMQAQNLLGRVKIIVFSNLGSEEDILRANAFGITNYIIKSSFTLDELVAKIQQTLD